MESLVLVRDKSSALEIVLCIIESILDDVVKDKETLFVTKFSGIQEWFLRSSYSEKRKFILSLIYATEDVNVIVSVLKLLNNMYTKDVLYVMSQSVHSFWYDVIPQDDNRSINKATLHLSQVKTLKWFSSLRCNKQVDVLLGLSFLGGGSLIRYLYEKSCDLATKKCTSIIPITVDKMLHEKDDKEGNEQDNEQQHISETEGINKIEDFINKGDDIPKEAEQEISPTPLTLKVKELQGLWEKKMKSLKKELTDEKKPSSSKRRSIKRKGRIESEKLQSLDKVQLLPVPINRVIINMIHEKQLNVIKDVNNYWFEMVKDVRNERKVREYHDNLIYNLERTNSKRRGASTMDNIMIDRSKMHESGEQFTSALLLKHQFKNIRMLHIPYRYTSITNTFFYSRVIDCDSKRKLLAVSSSDREVILFSLITGSRLSTEQMCCKDNALITAMCFHPGGGNIIIGYEDGCLNCWNIWTNIKKSSGNAIKISYNPHTRAVKSLSVSNEYVVSVGLDKKVKVFNVWSGMLLTTIDEETVVKIVHISERRNFIYYSSSPGLIKIHDFILKKPVTEVKSEGNINVLYVKPPLLISGGFNGLVRAWDCEKLERGPLITFNHGSKITGIAVSFMHIISGCEAGWLKLLNIFTGELVQSITVTFEYRPIIHIRSVEYEKAMQIIVNSETEVGIHVFLVAFEAEPSDRRKHHANMILPQKPYVQILLNTSKGNIKTQRGSPVKKRLCAHSCLRSKRNLPLEKS